MGLQKETKNEATTHDEWEARGAEKEEWKRTVHDEGWGLGIMEPPTYPNALQVEKLLLL